MSGAILHSACSVAAQLDVLTSNEREDHCCHIMRVSVHHKKRAVYSYKLTVKGWADLMQYTSTILPTIQVPAEH